MIRIVLLSIALLCALAALYMLRSGAINPQDIAQIAASLRDITTTSNQLLIGENAASDNSFSLPISPMREYDFLTRQEIFKVRGATVAQYPQLVAEDYAPSQAVFGQIIDNKPWWGIWGLLGYGPGKRGIEGPSDESRFIDNPLLLIGLTAPAAFITGEQPPRGAFLAPSSLTFEPDSSRATAFYRASPHFAYQRQIGYQEWRKRLVTAVAYNARDFGFKYLLLDAKYSYGVEPAHDAGKTFVRLNQFVHVGSSCGYPGGCNNMSPYQPGLELTVTSMPALASFKLWKEQPQSALAKEDFRFVIRLR